MWPARWSSCRFTLDRLKPAGHPVTQFGDPMELLPANYGVFLGACVLLVLAPGPDMAYFLGRTIAQGRRAGVLAVLGINAGAYVHLLATVLGLAALLAGSARAFSVIKWLGAGYLVWIGVQALLGRSGPLQLDEGGRRRSGATIFRQGFLSDVLNPKVSLFYLAFLPQFVQPGGSHPTLQLVLLGVTLNVVALAINLLLVSGAAAATARLRSGGRLVTVLNRALGSLFIALGVRLAAGKL